MTFLKSTVAAEKSFSNIELVYLINDINKDELLFYLSFPIVYELLTL